MCSRPGAVRPTGCSAAGGRRPALMRPRDSLTLPGVTACDLIAALLIAPADTGCRPLPDACGAALIRRLRRRPAEYRRAGRSRCVGPWTDSAQFWAGRPTTG